MHRPALPPWLRAAPADRWRSDFLPLQSPPSSHRVAGLLGQITGEYVARARVQPTVTKDGQRASGLQLGDPRVMAVMLALTMFGFLVHGFRHRELREKVATWLGCKLEEYSAARMSYDLRRLRPKGLRRRAEESHRYYLTSEGWKLARQDSRQEARVFRPLLTEMEGTVHGLAPPLERALAAVDEELDKLLAGAIPMKKVA